MSDETEIFTFRVEGIEQQTTYLPRPEPPFAEMFEVEGEHPADALAKLLHEIEWGVIDGYGEFTITHVPKPESGSEPTPPS